MEKFEKGCSSCPYSGHIELKECPDAYTDKAPFCNFYNIGESIENSELTGRQRQKLVKYIRKLIFAYKVGVDSTYVNKPMSWALYQTWKECDQNEQWKPNNKKG